MFFAFFLVSTGIHMNDMFIQQQVKPIRRLWEKKWRQAKRYSRKNRMNKKTVVHYLKK